MAIKELITLEGVEQVKRALNDLGAAGENALGEFRKLGTEATGTGFAKVSEGATKAAKDVSSFHASTKPLRETLHVLRPALAELGASVGGLGHFAIAARAGLIGLGAAITGAIIVKTTLVADSAAKAKAQLGDLLQSKPAGDTAFAILSRDAQKLGADVDALLPAFQSLIRAGQDFSSINFFAAPGQELPASLSKAGEAADALKGLFGILRLGRASFDEATKASTQFSDELEKQGKLTGQVAALLRPFPAAFNALKNALGGSGQTAKQFIDQLNQSPKSIDDVMRALGRLGNELPKTFDPKAPQSLNDAFVLLGDAIKRGFSLEQPKALEGAIARLAPQIEDISRGLAKLIPPAFGALTKFFQDLRKDIELTIDDVANIAEIWTEFKRLIQIGLTATTIGPIAEQFQKLKDVFKSIRETGLAPGIALDRFKRAAEEAGTTGKESGDKTKEAYQAAAPVIDRFREAFDALGLSAQRAGQNAQATAATLKTVTAPLPGATPAGFLTPPAPGASPFAQAPTAPEKSQAQTQALIAPFQAAADSVKQIWTSLLDFIADNSRISAAFSSLADTLVEPFLDAEQGITDVFDDIAVQAEDMSRRIIQAARQAAEAIQQLSFSGFGGSASGAPFASGGFVSGPGTSTSDSIPALLSAGEFVHPTARVRQYGLDFMEAIRRGLLSTDVVRMLMGDMRGFSHGGHAASMPRFANGGAVSGGSSRTLNLILEGQTFPLSGSPSVIDALEREASLRSVASAGIPQTFVGRR